MYMWCICLWIIVDLYITYNWDIKTLNVLIGVFPFLECVFSKTCD